MFAAPFTAPVAIRADDSAIPELNPATPDPRPAAALAAPAPFAAPAPLAAFAAFGFANWFDCANELGLLAPLDADEPDDAGDELPDDAGLNI